MAGIATQPPAHRGRLTVTHRALARLLSQTVRDSSPDLQTATAPSVRIRGPLQRRRATVRLAACYPAPLPDALDAARRSADNAAAALPCSRPRLGLVEITALAVKDTARDGTRPGAAWPGPVAAPAAPPVTLHRDHPARRWTDRRPAVSVLCALTTATVAFWCYRQADGTWPPPRLDAALRTVGSTPAGSAPAVAGACILALAGLVLLTSAATGTHVHGWRLPTRMDGPRVIVDPSLVRRGILRAVMPVASAHPIETDVRRRRVRVTTTADEAGEVSTALLQSATLAALRDAGITGPRPRVVVRLRHSPRHASNTAAHSMRPPVEVSESAGPCPSRPPGRSADASAPGKDESHRRPRKPKDQR